MIEGRDIGTVVAPHAPVKVYLSADRDVRAQRRQAERPDIGADALATDLRVRDEKDAERMQPAADAAPDRHDEPRGRRRRRPDRGARPPRTPAGVTDLEVEAEELPQELAGTVAIVGFPNVGKSTLVNRLTQTRAAVVHETPGVTRDRKELVCEWNGKRFLLIDTGGVDVADPSPITRSIADQARAAVEEADLVLFVVDARAGITPGDEELAEILRAATKPVIAAREQDRRPAADAFALEFHRLGLGDPVPLSAMHGHGTGDLLDEIVAPAARLRPRRGRRPRRSASRSSAARTSASRRC